MTPPERFLDWQVKKDGNTLIKRFGHVKKFLILAKEFKYNEYNPGIRIRPD